jgi:DNA-directed RNA polymerase specialized sigma24 family protein
VKDAPEADTVIRVLYDRYRLPLFGYILRSVGGDHQYAEDIVQETMVRAWQQASELDVERAAVVVHRRPALDHLRTSPSRVACGGGADRQAGIRSRRR